MKLPPPSERHKIKRGQIWQHNEPNRQGEIIALLVTGTKGSDYVHTVRLDNRKCQHRMRTKDLWLFYSLVGKNGQKQSHNI